MKAGFLKISLLSLSMACLTAANAMGQSEVSTQSTFNVGEAIDVVAMKILCESPGFQADIYSFRSLEADLKTSSNLPDPELSGEYLVMPQDVDNRWTAEISWGLDWPGVYRAKGNEAKSKKNMADKAMYARRIEKLSEIKDLLLDYILCRQKCILLDELDKNNKKIYELSEAQTRNREMTLLDLNKVKIEYSNIKSALASLYEEETEIIGTLSEIYGDDCEQLLKNLDCRFPEIYIPGNIEMNQIRNNSPQYQTVLAEAETARQGKKVSKMEALPSLSIGYKHQYEDGMHFNGATLGISIPIFSSRGKQKAAAAQILEADFNVETTAGYIETEVNTLTNRLKLLKQQVEEISPYVEDTDYNSVLVKAYEEGLLSLLDYISERNYFTNAAIEFVTLRHSAAKIQNKLQKYLQTYSF